MQLFGMLWTKDTSKKIVVETNPYANEVIVVALVNVLTSPTDHAHVDDFVVIDIDPKLGVGNRPVGPRSRVKGAHDKRW